MGIFASQLAQVVRSSLLAYGSQASAPDLRQLRDIADAAITSPSYETRMINCPPARPEAEVHDNSTITPEIGARPRSGVG